MRQGSRRHQTLTALVVLAAATSMASCNGADPPPSRPSPVRPTAVPTTNSPTQQTPSATGPTDFRAVPQAARAHTKAGAQAFAEFYITQLNKAWTTPDPEILRPYSTPACKACAAYISSADAMLSEGTHYDGTPVTVQASTYLPESSNVRVLIRIINTQEARRIIDVKGKVVRTVPKAVNQAQFEVSWQAGAGWKMDAVKDVQAKN